jgi:hypothetical protein
LDHKIGSSYLVPCSIQFPDPISRSNFSIQFFDPGQPGGWLGRQLTDFRPPGDSHPQLAVQKAAVGIGRPPDPMYPIFSATFSVPAADPQPKLSISKRPDFVRIPLKGDRKVFLEEALGETTTFQSTGKSSSRP